MFFYYDKFDHAADASSAILESNCSFIDSCSGVKGGRCSAVTQKNGMFWCVLNSFQ